MLLEERLHAEPLQHPVEDRQGSHLDRSACAGRREPVCRHGDVEDEGGREDVVVVALEYGKSEIVRVTVIPEK
jgi:hypothetical protein